MSRFQEKTDQRLNSIPLMCVTRLENQELETEEGQRLARVLLAADREGGGADL